MKLQTNNGTLQIKKPFPKNNGGNEQSEIIERQLEAVDQQLEKTRKIITSYDVYKITEFVTSPDEFFIKLLRLLPNNGLIINCGNFIIENKLYAKGDIIIKDNYGQISMIKAQAGGTYFPSELLKEGTSYTIKYKYSNAAPKETESTIELGGGALDAPARTIVLKGLIDEYKGGVYGYSKVPTGNSVEIELKEDNGEIVSPIIRFLTKDGEEVYCSTKRDTTVEKDTTKTMLRISEIPYIVERVVVK